MVTQTVAGYRLSQQQKHLWLLQQSNSNYQATCTIEITGKVKANVLKSAMEKIVERHEILRTTFQRRPGIKMPLQVISDTAKISWTHVNLSHLNSQEQQAKFEEILQQENLLISQLEPEPSFNSSLLTLRSDRHLLLLSLPSLIADGLTLKNLACELAKSYHICLSNSDFEEEAVQYLQYSEWQNELLEDEEAAEEIAYWQKQNFSWATLPFEKQVRGEIKFKPERYSFEVNPQIEAKLSPDVSLDKFLLACWQTLLWRLTKKSEIAVKTVFDGRQFEELQEVTGLLAKSLPICCEFSDNLKFSELLGQVSDRSTEAEEKQEYFIDPPPAPLEKGGAREAASINFEFIDLSEKYFAGEFSLEIETKSVIFDRFKVKLNCLKTARGISADFEYDPALISREAIASFAKQFDALVIGAAENIDAPVGELKIATESEIKHLLDELNQTQKTYPQDKCVHHLFEERVKLTPNNIAVVFEDQQLTYLELNEKANQLAHYLQELGVVPETIVTIYLERSLDSVIALLAILKSGAAYLPIDTALPVESLAFRLKDAGVNILLTQQEIPGETLGENIKIIATNDAKINQQSKANPTSNATVENLAYILYTSGSTGKPKGVAIEHRQILNYLYAILDKLQPETIATFATVSTFAADLGNTMIFPALCSGGCLHVIPQEVASDAEATIDYFRSRAIDYLKIVPSHLATLLASNPSPFLLPRRGLILGGEASSWDLIEQIREKSPQCRIINHYGPTETTVGVLTYNVENRESNAKTVPIGRPLANAQVYILDEKLQPVTVGVPGELYIAGAGLARGYLNRPELTAEKFVTQPELGRLYKTGDLVRYLPDSEVARSGKFSDSDVALAERHEIEFLGRIDNQVKIRGYRIELGEIEAAIATHPEVKTTVVVTRENNSGNKRLIAYFVSGKNQLSQENLRQFLQDKLADYAIPSAFVKLEFLPLTPNGKIDRQGLPDPDSIRPELEKNFVAPRTPTEEILAKIWSQLLEVEKIGVFDNFFELGGHSLLATILISKIRETFEVKIPLKTLFDSPTIVKLAKTIEEIRQTGAWDAEKIDFNAEAVLDPTIIPQTAISQNIAAPQNILLTGVTGFVGAYLLDKLLRKTSANIYCLIRANDLNSAKQKLQNQLESYLLWDEKFSSRIILVVGDLSSNFLGLSTEEFNSLASRIDVIYHSGAWVNHVYPYTALKATNVLGTEEVLRLASKTHIKPVHYISTLGVLSLSGNSEDAVVLESDRLTETPENKSGYQQSKWVAEKLVMAASDRGIPTCIYRLPMITGSTDTGASNINDRICRQIKGCLQLGMVPNLNSKLVDNWIPVNQISQAIVRLSQQQESLGKAFHLLNPNPTSFNNLFDWICSLDSSVKKVSLNDWAIALSNHPENVLYPYLLKLEFQIEKYADAQLEIPARVIDDRHTKNGLDDSEITFNSIDDKYLETMLSYLKDSGFLSLPELTEK